MASAARKHNNYIGQEIAKVRHEAESFRRTARRFQKQEGDMNQTEHDAEGQESGPPERIPAMQQILDNPFLLLFIGITIPTVLYIVWGVMEIASIPVGN
jgi:hypothetical protein